MLLKSLIAVACLVVIGFVGFAAWDRYEAGRIANERETFLSFCELNFLSRLTSSDPERRCQSTLEKGLLDAAALASAEVRMRWRQGNGL